MSIEQKGENGELLSENFIFDLKSIEGWVDEMSKRKYIVRLDNGSSLCLSYFTDVR